MKIGIDYHGVIDKKSRFFSIFTKRLINAGHEVHIITGHELTPNFIENLITKGIVWTKIFSISSYHKNKGTKVWYDKKNTPWMREDIWNRTKAEYCKKEDINLHIDDSKEYCKHFSTPYMLILK